MLIGSDAMAKLRSSHVAVFGVGGVGGHVVEALIRSGVGTLDLIDNDDVSISNINRQIIATTKTVGLPKVDVAKERVLEINPDVKINAIKMFYTPETASQFDFSQYDYIVDAIDTVVGKISIVEKAKSVNVPVICAMGAGNKLDPTKFEVADIFQTSVCPLARVMRNELKKRKITDVKVVYSKENPQKNGLIDQKTGKPLPASIAFVPSVVGLIIAGEVIKDLIR